MLDLQKLADEIDEALAKETEESLTEFLRQTRAKLVESAGIESYLASPDLEELKGIIYKKRHTCYDEFPSNQSSPFSAIPLSVLYPILEQWLERWEEAR